MAKNNLSRAFTMIEMLVVIAIIAILVAVIMGTFSGGTDSAQTAKCLSNMRNLAAACQSAGVASGQYPLPSSLEYWEHEDDDNGGFYTKYTDSSHRGWISWDSGDAYPSRTSKKSDSWRISMYSEDDDAYRHSLTNGVIWKYLNGNHEMYLCPGHEKSVRKKTKHVHWSYVMNAYFNGSILNKGSSKRTRLPIGSTIKENGGWLPIYYGKLNRAERFLLFAEVPFIEKDKKFDFSQTVSIETSGDSCDSVLQYDGFPGASSSECIGFNHKDGRRYCANVVFADGHTEKLRYPDGGSESDIKELTKWLCTGVDVSFDGKTYEKFDN